MQCNFTTGAGSGWGENRNSPADALLLTDRRRRTQNRKLLLCLRLLLARPWGDANEEEEEEEEEEDDGESRASYKQGKPSSLRLCRRTGRGPASGEADLSRNRPTAAMAYDSSRGLTTVERRTSHSSSWIISVTGFRRAQLTALHPRRDGHGPRTMMESSVMGESRSYPGRPPPSRNLELLSLCLPLLPVQPTYRASPWQESMGRTSEHPTPQPIVC